MAPEGFLSVFTFPLLCLCPLVSSIPHIDSSLFLCDFCLSPHSLISRPSQPPPSSRTCWVWYAGAQALRLMVRGAPVPTPPPPKPPTFPCRVSIRMALYLTCNYMYVCAHGCYAISTVHTFLHIWKMWNRYVRNKQHLPLGFHANYLGKLIWSH